MILPLILFGIFRFTEECAPTPGVEGTSNKVTYTMTVQPPVRWTFDSASALGQATSSSSAISAAQSDIEQAIKLILIDNQFNHEVINKTDVSFTPLEGPAVIDCADASSSEGDLLVVDGTVTNTCTAGNAVGPEVENKIVINLSAAQPATKDQWNLLAAKLQDRLIQKKADFNGNIVVSY